MNNKNIINFDLSGFVENQYGKFAKYVILDRALPNVSDGLKPVQRRVLYACYKLGLFFDKPYKKSARVVGEVIAKYHPHGDTSVYNAMLRMSQEWKMRLPLIETQGNNGSIDGDSPAAMRYTEVKLSKYAHFLLDYIPYDIINYMKNFDDSEIEPIILPAIVPNLLINGAIGIAAGYATDIHPHNPTEVIDAVILRLKKPHCFLSEITRKIKGPDYPTGGIIIGGNNAIKGYKSGRAKFIIRSKVEIINKSSNKEIIITEIPFGVVKSNLTKQIEMLRISNKLDGIKEVRDESNFEGIRIVVVVKPTKSVNYVYKYLLKNTQLQINSNYNMVAINNNKPTLHSLTMIIDAFIVHITDIYKKYFEFELNKNKKKLEIINGLIIIIENIKEAIDILLGCTSKKAAEVAIIKRFKLSQRQADAVLQLKLHRLTSSNVDEFKNDGKKTLELVNFYTNKLSSELILKESIITKLRDVQLVIGSKRKTVIVSELEDLVVDEFENTKNNPITVFTTKNGYCGKINSFVNIDKIKIEKKELPISLSYSKNKEIQCWFTSGGNFFSFKGYRLSTGKTMHLNKIVKYDSEKNKILTSLVMNNEWKDLQCFVITNLGHVKRFNLDNFERKETLRITKIIKLKSNDFIQNIFIYDKKFADDKKIFLASKNGQAISFKISDISVTKIRSGTVKGFKLKDDNIVTSWLYNNALSIKLVNSNLLKKSFNASDYEGKKRTSFGYSLFSKKTSKKILFGFCSEINYLSFLKINDDLFSWNNRTELEIFEKIKKLEIDGSEEVMFNSINIAKGVIIEK